DSIVWCNRLGADTILKQPNPIMTWREIVYQHFVYKLATGNAFFRASMPENITADAIKFQWCSNYWSLPAHLVQVKPMEHSYGVPMFGIANIDELIKGYTLNLDAYSGLTIPYYQIWHDRDGLPELIKGVGYLKAESRLLSVKKPIANLIAVYEARNVIFLKRGALGFIVAQKADETGTIALEPDEKEALRKEVDSKYGVSEGKSPYAITDVPINFVRTNLSISELQPFDETLEDAIKIASVFGIPSVLVPRKDQSTFSNQDTAEKSVYTSVIIPAAKRFCEAITTFLGLEKKGLYLDCDFSDVACLQVGLKEREEVKKMVNERCLSQFNCGLISINDWRSQIHEDALEGDIFDKTKFEMTPEEIAVVDRVIKSQTTPIQITTNSINNHKPSKGDSNERTDD
ncbi:MAG: phage portal protein, partial [Duncaniella sp.]|nr:phage portal protein [Duncaniella sp.]